ncbi:hypothetical protein Tco_0281989 [Tanacetum coccineum]
MISTVFLLYSYEYVFKHIFGELRGNVAEIISNSKPGLKYKVTDNDTNITGLKSHDCHIMMQRLLPYGLQNYMPDKIAKPIIELCSLFKQICSTTLMEDDMLKAQIKVVDIMCDLELIYPPALFDIMIHLVIHLPLQTFEGGPIRPRRDERRTTQNSGICSPGPDGEMYYGQLQEILEFKNNMTQIDTRAEAFKDDQYILVTQVKQVFYLEDKAKPYWRVVEQVNHKNLNDLDNATLHIDGQSTEVDAPPDIIDVVDQDDDITDDEDALPHDLADTDDEDLINVDDDGVEKVYSSKEED